MKIQSKISPIVNALNRLDAYLFSKFFRVKPVALLAAVLSLIQLFIVCTCQNQNTVDMSLIVLLPFCIALWLYAGFLSVKWMQRQFPRVTAYTTLLLALAFICWLVYAGAFSQFVCTGLSVVMVLTLVIAELTILAIFVIWLFSASESKSDTISQFDGEDPP